jgi:hypothetical protein
VSSKEFWQWEAEFPRQFSDIIYIIYGLKRKKAKSFKYPQSFVWFARKYIYHPLENSHSTILYLLY